ncbi:SCO family protein [Rhizosaccharibacter radicis]|uniref:SCO family protein n=1 Tax=Rhizosaccharibacter radicis TaxID=2782605 RepID=A0ABT1W2Y9_9PROT|nr:SCO family protein [Acetobacteraceae bacterium KSS12]
MTNGNQVPPATNGSGAPSLWWVLAPLGLALALLGGTLPYILSTPDTAAMGRMSAMRPVGGPFRLVDGDGRVVTEHSWPGRFLLIYFGYTHCPASCPTALNAMAEAVDGMGDAAGRVQPLFITVDPARDDRATMKDYAAQFSPRLSGLTGTPAAVAEAARHYHINYRARPQTGGGYAMDHSSIVYLMSPDGRLAAMIPADEKPDAMRRDIVAAMR